MDSDQSHPLLSAIDKAPDDVLQIVVEYCQRDELVRLSRVSRRFNALVEPWIYGTIQCEWDQGKDPPMLLLLRTILSSLVLAARVKRLILGGKTFHTQAFSNCVPSRIAPLESQEDMKNIIALAEQSVITKQDTAAWIQGLSLGTMDAILAFLIPQLSNLVYLSLGANYTRDTKYMNQMLTHNISSTHLTSHPTFASLQEINISSLAHSAYWGDPKSTLFVLPFFYLPNIKRLSILIAESESIIWPPHFTTPPNATSLTSLSIRNLREYELGKILICCPNLQSLSYHWYAEYDIRTPPPFLSCSELAAALDKNRDTLTSLTLSAKFQPSQEVLDDLIPTIGMHDTVTNLPHFHALEKLEIPFIFLLGWKPSSKNIGELLPRGIKYLTLSDDMIEDQGDDDWYWAEEGNFLNALRLWLGDWRRDTPFLKHLCLVVRQEDRCWGDGELERLRGLGGEFGVEVEVRREKFEWGF